MAAALFWFQRQKIQVKVYRLLNTLLGPSKIVAQ